MTVYFSPITQKTYSGTVSVNANQTGGTSSIAVSGTALPATRIMSLTGDLAFPDTEPGSTTTRSLTISNRGNDALYVSGFSYPTGFSVSWSGSIAPGDSYTVTVTFAPITSTAYRGTLTVLANQTFGSNTVALSGVGAVPTGIQVLWQHAPTGSLDSWYVKGATVTAESPPSISQVADLSWHVVGTGDLNGDGTPDIVWQHAFYGWLAVWFMNGSVVTSTELLSIERVTDLDWVICAVGDIDGDGHADLIWQHRTGGWIAAWLMNGAQVVSTTLLSIPRISVDWEVAGAGDLNADGKADLVFQHRTGGWLAAWYLQGPTVTVTELLSVSRTPHPDWHIRGVGDCDGDGHADLLWQNDASGALGVWFLSGTTVVGYGTLSMTHGDATCAWWVRDKVAAGDFRSRPSLSQKTPNLRFSWRAAGGTE